MMKMIVTNVQKRVKMLVYKVHHKNVLGVMQVLSHQLVIGQKMLKN